ncbi:MAG: Exonuclease SbcC [Myxococcaceae bacterium]|nr:Exonuclease SbcC [Myxococcaceae bacterium]
MTTNGTGANGTSSEATSRILARSPSAASAPLKRRTGRVAEEAQLRARLELARVMGDHTEERATSRLLAERLASRDAEIDAAIELALRTLAAVDDPELRHALAGWLEGLGEPGLAASELRKIQREDDSVAAAGVLVRIGVLHARAGDAHGAQEALSEAAALDEIDALSLELLGAIAAWAPDALSPRAGAEAYVRAAKRRGYSGESEGELEDLLRAFELDPSSPLATATLVAAHLARQRVSAADEILRAHALALAAHGGVSAGDASEVHARRRAQALERGDLPRAFGAALDEGLDAVVEGADADAMDDLLVRAGAFETLAVRLEIRAEGAASAGRGRAAAQKWAELGRLLSGPLASTDRAIEAYARSVAADATNADALHALRALALKSGSSAWVVEGLVRAAMGSAGYGGSADVAARVAGARALALLAEETNDDALAAWAHRVVAELDGGDERARAASTRFAPAAQRRNEEIELADRTLETSAEGGRVETLVELVRLLRSAPGRSRQLASTIEELTAARPDDDALFSDALRIAERTSDFPAVARLCRDRLARGAAPPRVRLALVSALRRAGDLAGAAKAASDLFDACTPWAYSVAWITAAFAGDRATRARALASLAPTCGAPVVAVLAAVASEQLAAVGDLAGARSAAEQACRADAEDARAIRALSAVVLTTEGRIATTALERAAAVGGPTAPLCLGLAQAFENAGDATSSIAWARRAVALRPGDAGIVQALIDRATRLGDESALADAIAWLLPQPVPARVTADRLAPALRSLGARDPARAALLGRRALDVLGPRHALLRAAIEEVADEAKDGGLRARVVERWIAAGAPAAERGPLLLTLAEHHRAVGDVQRELSAYVRAARAGVDLAPVRERIDALYGSEQSPDAELALLEARAELHLDEGRTDTAAQAFRELGAALWDMADDRPRAVQAWLRAAQLDSARGYATLRRDLSMFADVGYAVDCLAELVEREGDRARAGIIATEAARAAVEVKAYPRAIALARTALERHPSHAEALAIAELASEKLGRLHEMSPIYDYAARGALGRFGRRAAHHRAARFFEAHAPMLALKHAAQAFIAVPSEGTTLTLLERTAERAQRRSVAVRTVEHVADLSRSQNIRAVWLLRAATLTSRDLEGARQRVDLLLKAAVLSPNPVTLGMLSVAARELVSLAPDDGEAIAMRLERASDSLAKSLEGPDGARIAITFAEMALDLFEDAAWAWRAVERALDADADVDEYVRLTKFADALARAEGASESLGRVVAACEKPYSNVGVALLRLVGSVAAAMGDGPRSVRAFVQAAEKDPDDDETIAQADAAVTAHPEPAFVERLSKKIGVFRRSQALRSIAAKRNELGDHASAVSSLERALQIAPYDARADIARELDETLKKAGRGEEAVLRAIAAPGVSAKERAEQWQSLAKIREERGDKEGATDALLQAATDDPSAAAWAAVERAAEASGREHIRVQALQNLALHVDDQARLGVQKRLARAEGARGSLAAAEQAWREVLASDPGDSEADVAIEALLVARASYDELAGHLARRAARLAASGAEKETLRAIRLRRAAILEQRLGRLDEAAAELELLLRETPHHASALRWLADLYERANAPKKALPVLEELAASATDPVEQEAIGARRVRALVATGDVEAARGVLAALLQRRASSAAVHEARVEIARADQDPVALGAALEDLARVSPEDARVRSELLVEAAQAAARAGDTDTSLARAKDAARLAPDVASTQLFARGLEYRLRGAGTADEAKATVAALARLDGDTTLEPEDVALRGFLLAEAEDVLTPGAGEKTLRECLVAVGPQPLLTLGLAERTAAALCFADAVQFYADAVYGNLLGLRRPGRVALAAADAAERVVDTESMLRFLNEAAKDPETRVEALRRLAQISLVTHDVGKARNMLRGLADSLEGGEKAEILAQLARALFESTVPSERLEADRTLREAIEAAPAELAERLREQLGGFRSRPPPVSSNPPSPSVSRAPSGPMRVAPPMPTPPPGWPHTGEARQASSRPPAPQPAAVIGNLPTAPQTMSVVPDQAARQANAAEELFPSVRHPPLGAPRTEPPPPPNAANAAAIAERVAEPVAPAPSSAAAHAEARRIDTAPELDVPVRAASMPPAASSPSAGPSGAPEITAVSATSRVDPHVARVVEARKAIASGDREHGEKILSDALREGSLAAADELDKILSEEPSRAAALVKVRRQAVELVPGDLTRLASLRDAARLDKNPNYVRAIDHVLRAFDGRQSPLAPPPLSAQQTQPGMLTLLTRHSRELAGEAFGVVWENASNIFAKPPALYRMTGLERVAPGPMWTLSRLYEVALRLLDTPRFALYHRRGSGPLTLTVALLQNPSAILGGEAREDSADVRWMLGHALASVLPQNALPIGLPDTEGRVLWDVLLGAFGPPTRTKMDRAHANLAEMLWQTLAPRAQRRLKELLGNDDSTPFELVVERANQSGRRVGMFLTGDFAHAARTVLGEHAALDVEELQRPGGLARLCGVLPSLADLYRLAVRPEYADARWHVPSPQSSRFPFAGDGRGGPPPV